MSPYLSAILRCHSYLDAGGQQLADTLSIVNGGLTQEDVDHWWNGDLIKVDGTFGSLLLASERVESIQGRLEELYRGWPALADCEDLWRVEFLMTMERLNLATEDDISELGRRVQSEDGKDDLPASQMKHPAHHAPPAESLVLHVAEDAKGMTVTANGKEIRFRASHGKPTKEMQIVRVLIAKYPEGATAAELLRAAWPDAPKAAENLKRLGAITGTLRNKARNVGLPEDIFPRITSTTLKAVKFCYVISCGKIEGGDVFKTKADCFSNAKEYDKNQGVEQWEQDPSLSQYSKKASEDRRHRRVQVEFSGDDDFCAEEKTSA